MPSEVAGGAWPSCNRFGRLEVRQEQAHYPNSGRECHPYPDHFAVAPGPDIQGGGSLALGNRLARFPTAGALSVSVTSADALNDLCNVGDTPELSTTTVDYASRRISTSIGCER
jgi:hypothetical protein